MDRLFPKTNRESAKALGASRPRKFRNEWTASIQSKNVKDLFVVRSEMESSDFSPPDGARHSRQRLRIECSARIAVGQGGLK